METLANLGISIVGGAVAALITVWLSLHRFYQERWWEKKLAAYTAVIEALHNIKQNFSEEWEAEILGKEHRSSSIGQEVHERSMAELRRAADIGELLFSAEATSELDKLLIDLTNVHNPDHIYFDYLDGSLRPVIRCLTEIKRLARLDLKLRRSWFPWTK